jgi:flagellar basal body-associated protein FliL
MSKKAQGLSMNVIIIAAIALLVLVVLVAIFTGKMGDFTGGLKDAEGDSSKTCSEQDGVSTTKKAGQTADQACVDAGRTYSIPASDATGTNVCCR